MTDTSAPIRSFVAIELPVEVKHWLRSLQRDLRDRVERLPGNLSRRVRWVDPEAIHVTLKFLGNVQASQLPHLSDALASSLAGAYGCRCTLSLLGMFPDARRPRVLWIGLSGELATLADLHRRVEEATLPLGFAPELRPFNPHLTLARLQEDVGPTDRRVFGTAMMTAPVSTGPFVDGRVVSLMRSELSRGGPTYSRIAAIPVL